MDISPVFVFFAILNLSLTSFVEAYKCPKLLQTDLVPVFIPVNHDGSLNLGLIKSEYAPYLSKAGVTSLEINAPTTGSMALNIEMAMEIILAWIEVKEKYGFQLICQVGGYTFPDVITLAKFACKVGCDGLMVLPELYYKVNATSLLVDMVSKVADACSDCGVSYNDVPEITGVNLNMIRFFAEASKRIRSFAGIKTSSYTTAVYVASSNDLKPCQYLIVSGAYTLVSTYAYGFNATSTPLGNSVPKQIIEIQNAVKNNDLKRANEIQQQLNSVTGAILRNNGRDSLDGTLFSYSDAFYKWIFVTVTNIDVGPVLYPQPDLTDAVRAAIDRLAPAYKRILTDKYKPVVKTIYIKSYSGVN